MPTKYIVIELQTAADGTVANIVTAYDTQLQAESAYHSILSAAAVSNIPAHAAVMIDSMGYYIDAHCYEHEDS